MLYVSVRLILIVDGENFAEKAAKLKDKNRKLVNIAGI
jgi:hypothetical protein